MELSKTPQRARRRDGSFFARGFLARAGGLAALAAFPGLAGGDSSAPAGASVRAAWSASARSCRRFRTRLAIAAPAFVKGLQVPRCGRAGPPPRALGECGHSL